MSNQFEDLQQEVYTAIEEVLFGDEDPSQCEVHSASPLDPRAKTSDWFVISGNLIVRTSGVKALDYYGGFEYIDDDHRFNLGPYTVYDGKHSMVLPVIDAYQNQD